MMTDLMAEQSFVRDIPRAISLGDHPALFCVGDEAVARAAVRAMVMHAAFFHTPQDLGIAVITSEEVAPRWDWVKWLPHHREDGGSGHMTYASAADFVAALGESYSSRGMFNSSAARRSGMAGAGGMASAASSGQSLGRLLIVVCDSGFVDWSSLLRAAHGVLDTGVEGVCFVVLGEDDGPLRTPTRTLTFTTAQRVLRSETDKDAPALLGVPDQVPEWAAEAFARRMAAWRPGTKASALLDSGEDATPKLRLGSLIGIDDWANFDPNETWKWAKNRRNLLRVPVGQFIDSGRPWYLDMSEDADAHGPHFGLGGSTGSGKSEFLRVHVLALCCTHSPQDLVCIPADFKGTQTFLGLEQLPHVLMVLNNLESNPDSVQRLIQALMGELERRQRMLGDAGALATAIKLRAPANIDEYRALCVKRPELDLPPMPHLYIPFDELMQAKRTFPELLSIMRITGTVGRSLGVHMAPVSQTLDDSLMAGIGTHLTARIGLKMNEPRDYRPVLGTSNPGALPARKGVGYWVPNLESPAQRVQVAYVSGTYVPPEVAAEQAEQIEASGEARPRVLSGFRTSAVTALERVFGASAGPADAVTVADPADEDLEQRSSDDDDEVGEDISSTDMGMAIRVLKEHGGTIDHILWLPELFSYTPVFDAVATYIRDVQPELAAGFLDWDAGHPGRYVPDLVRDFSAGPLTPVAACGIVDRPRDHAQDVLKINLGHNTAFAGAADSGKSYTLLSIITSTAALYSSKQVQFYCLDLGGGELSWLRGLHHVGAVISGDGDVYSIGRMISHVQHIMNRRASQWAAARVNTVDEWRQRRFGAPSMPAAAVPDDGYGDVYLVINGFDKFLSAFNDQHGPAITQIAQNGPDRGVHLVVTLNSWTARHTFQLWDNFKSRYELRIENFNDSLMGSVLAQTVPQFPGRGMITASGATRARRGAVQVQGTDTVPPEPITWHVLYSAPGIVTPYGDQITLNGDTGAQVSAFVNDLHPGSLPAERMPELPPRILVSKIAAKHPPASDPTKILLGIQETDMKPSYWSPAADPHLVVLGNSESGRSTTLRLIGKQLQNRIETAPDGEKPLVFVFDQAEALVGAVMGGEYVYLPTQIPAAVEKIKQVLAARHSDEELTQHQLLERRSTGRRFEGPEVFVLIDNLTDFIAPMDPFNWGTLIEKGKMIGFHVIVSRIADQSLVGEWSGRGMLPLIKRTNAPVLLMNSPPGVINIVDKFRGQVLPPGRAMMVTRSGTTMIQVAVPDDEL
jgi:S-DNA-T family DNA segregation ATPase FtsK/SpoIIIE